MRPRAVAWDIDGTLVDSEGLHHAALVGACERWGADVSDLGDQHFRGIHMADVWRVLAPRLPVGLRESEWLAAIATHYIANRHTLRPLPGALDAIAALTARGIPQACVSNSHRAIVEANLEALGVLRHMAFTISFDDVTAGKPDPAPYRLAAETFGLPPAAILAVEDSRAGTLSAVAAGLPVALCWPLAGPWTGEVTEVTSVIEVLRWFD